MSFEELMSVTNDLPYTLQDQIRGFATFVEDAADDLLEAVGARDIHETIVNQLVYAAGVWRLWQSINGLISLLSNSLTSLADTRVDGFQLGDTIYSTQSPEYAMLTNLRDDLRQVLRTSGFEFVLSSASLTELTRAVVQADGR
jgi:hypothetical protein